MMIDKFVVKFIGNVDDIGRSRIEVNRVSGSGCPFNQIIYLPAHLDFHPLRKGTTFKITSSSPLNYGFPCFVCMRPDQVLVSSSSSSDSSSSSAVF